MAVVQWVKWFGIAFCCAFSSTLLAQQEQTEIKYYENDDITNRIPYLDNRFHIDAQLEEITLLFYRRSGTPPIILVRPDGSKLKITNLPKDKVEWFDDKTFDMIRIIRPMPGPWQAIGEILPNSKIMVVTDVTLQVEPLAEILLSGETLKVTAKIYNQEHAVDDPLFNDVINLDIDFFSTNNTAYDNFGAEPVQIGSFRDDGYELDEYARDGVFTGEFVLDFSPGEWIPIYRVIMPMVTRELRQKPVIVHDNPVSLSVEPTIDPLKFHKVTITIDDSYVDPDSLLFQGKITFPDRQSEPFAIMEGEGKQRIKEIGYTEAGIHRISLNAFGRTKNGREFRLTVPDFTFNVEREDGPLVPTLDDDQVVTDSNEVNEAQLLAEQIAQEKAEREAELQRIIEEKRIKAEEEAMTNLIIVVVANILIIGGALAGFLIIRRKKR